MSVQSREVKVLAALLTSMTAAAIILVALGSDPPHAGAFCLSHYYSLEPIEEVISSRSVRFPGHWNRIEIYYSGTTAGNAERLPALTDPANQDDINCHFVVCNGFGGSDGRVQPTEKWRKQCSVLPARTAHSNAQTIRICVIADGRTARPTDFQIKRVEALIEGLRREFNIQRGSIRYPFDWRW